jgi:predicted dehydrogenase
VVGVCDLDAERAEELARRHGNLPVHVDLNDLLREQRPDVVHVLTPPQSHRDLTLQILEAGAHVLVEKPMALSKSDACETAEAAHARELRIGVSHNYLCVPAYQQGRSLGNVRGRH